MYNSQNFSRDTDCIPHRDNEPEWFEDAATDVDWIDNFSTTTGGVTASTHSMSFPDDVYEKSKTLEKELQHSEHKYKNLQVENQRLNVQFANERQRSSRLEKKLRYIEEHHEIFTHLKQAYMNMKYNETVGRSMVHVNEQSSQTVNKTSTYLSGTAEQKNKNDIDILNGDDTMIVVKKGDLSKLQETVLALKKMVDQREKTWSVNAERERLYKNNIATMQKRIEVLTDIVSKKAQEAVTPKEVADEMIQKENSFLRKIIIKLEQRQREMEKMCHIKKRQLITLTEVEKEMVQQLIHKYSNKLKQKIILNSINAEGNEKVERKHINEQFYNTAEEPVVKNHSQGDCEENPNFF